MKREYFKLAKLRYFKKDRALLVRLLKHVASVVQSVALRKSHRILEGEEEKEVNS